MRTEEYFAGLVEGIKHPSMLENTHKIAALLHMAWMDSSRVFIAGNGGAAAHALHFTADLRKNIANPLSPHRAYQTGILAYCLLDNMSLLSANANDLGYDTVFSEFLRSEGQSNHIFVVLSTSGSSKNVCRAAREALEKKMSLVAICAREESNLARIAQDSLLSVVHHPDIRGQEDLMGILCHAVVGELIRKACPEVPPL